jgi:FixJ family two-component response regulator
MSPSVEKAVILVVDDDDAVLSSLRFLLEAEGFGVCGFADGPRLLLHRARMPRFHCLVLDYQMPGMTGIELLRHLRSRRIDAPVILITGCWEASVLAEAAAAGIARVVHKPHLDAALVDAIRAVIAAVP